MHMLFVIVYRENDRWREKKSQLFIYIAIHCISSQINIFSSIYEYFSSASAQDEPQVLHNGNYRALFSASDQTHCALVVCDSE